MTEKTRYDPAEVYAPLAEPKTPPEAILTMLFEQTAPFIKSDIFLRATEVIQEIMSVRRALRNKFTHILKEFDIFDEIKDRLDWDLTDALPSVESICHLIPDLDTKERLRVRLSGARDAFTPDILERLGFTPREVFRRKEHETRISRGKTRHDRRFDLLSETFPREHPVEKFDGSLMASLPKRKRRFTREEIEGLNRLHARAEWMRRAGTEFQACVQDAFRLLDDYRSKMAPESEFKQPYTLFSDMNTKSAVELLEIVMSSHLPIQRRFDAMQVLEWAIGFYYVYHHDIYILQGEVQKQIHELLNLHVWNEKMKITVAKVVRDPEGNFIPEELSSEGTALTFSAMKARRLKDGIVSGILEKYTDVMDPGKAPCFDSRAKSADSIVTKLIILQEFYKKCWAKLKGLEVSTVGTLDEAREMLQKLEQRITKQYPEAAADMESEKMLRHFDMHYLRDNVGLTFAFSLRKELDDFTPVERERVNACFSEFAEHLVGVLDLEDVSMGKLWDGKNNKPLRDNNFRDFKIFGFRSIERKIALPNGKTKTRTVRVPVEIQIQPFKTYTLAESPGNSASVPAHQNRKALDLTERNLPQKIGSREMFPRSEPAALARAFAYNPE